MSSKELTGGYLQVNMPPNSLKAEKTGDQGSSYQFTSISHQNMSNPQLIQHMTAQQGSSSHNHYEVSSNIKKITSNTHQISTHGQQLTSNANKMLSNANGMPQINEMTSNINILPSTHRKSTQKQYFSANTVNVAEGHVNLIGERNIHKKFDDRSGLHEDHNQKVI